MTKHIPTDILLEAQRQMDVVAKIAHQRQVSDYQVKIVAKQLGVSPRTVRRMVRRYRNMPTLDVFLSRRYRTGSRYARIRKCGETEAIVQKILEERYIGREEEITLPKVLELINQQCRQSGADELSLGTLYRRVDQLEQRLKNSAKRRKTGLQPRQSKSGKLVTTRPLEHLQIDHTMVDKMLDLSPWGLGIRRPWLTLIIDIATRGIWGYYLSLVRPNVNACALAMMSGFIPKNVLVSRLGISLEPFQEKGIDEPWPCHGKGEIIHHDNAKEFLSPRFQWGVNYLGMKSQPRPIGKPHYGGHIERLIGRFMADVRMLPGTTFNNTVVRDDYPSEAKAGMTIEEFEVWLVLNILRYHMSVHHALGCSPYDQYRRLAAVTPKSPVRIPSLPEVRRAFLRWETRVIREGGIVLKHRHYNTDRLGPYLGQNVSIGWQDNDMSRIFVSLDHTFDHLEVPLAPHERQQRYWELWDKTSPRYGRVQEDARQKDLAAQLLKEMIEFGDQTKRIGHRPKLPKQIPEPCSAVTIQAPSKTQQQDVSAYPCEARKHHAWRPE